MFYKFKENIIGDKQDLKEILDEIGVENVILNDELLWHSTDDQNKQIEAMLNPAYNCFMSINDISRKMIEN